MTEPVSDASAEETAAPAGRPASGQAIAASVKWFLAAKGYGFLEAGDGTPDIFCHASAVRAAGRETLPRGAAVTCEVQAGERGRQVTRILAVEDPPADTPAEGRRPARPAARDGAQMRGEVKFFDAARGFGFVVPDDGGGDVFVHFTVLKRSGFDGLQPGQRVRLRAVATPRGRQATGIEPI